MECRDQHYVTRAYLDAWIDPDTPPEQEGYLWRFDKECIASPKKKSPKNVFYGNNIYTTYHPDGNRDLSVEKSLSKIEKDFIDIREKKLKLNESISREDEIKIIIFISAMLHRTKLCEENEKDLWEHILKVTDNMKARSTNSRSSMLEPIIKRDNEFVLTHEDVKRIAAQPLPNLLPSATNATIEILSKMNLYILTTTSVPGFITSDHPCVLFDPTIEHVALGSPTVEVTFPISPQLGIFFTWRHIQQKYIEITESMIDEINRRTRFFCYEYFVVNKNIKKDIWFQNTYQSEENA